jgi:hypothetical protein
MHLELFAQFSHRAVLSQGGQGHAGLERRIVRVPRAPRQCFLLDHNHKKPFFSDRFRSGSIPSVSTYRAVQIHETISPNGKYFGWPNASSC